MICGRHGTAYIDTCGCSACRNQPRVFVTYSNRSAEPLPCGCDGAYVCDRHKRLAYELAKFDAANAEKPRFTLWSST